MRKLLVLLAVLAGGTAAASAQAPQVADDPALPLVYVFSVDALDGDAIDAGLAPFLASLIAKGTSWPESRAVMVSETNPNHVAMATGAYGDRSGIPGNAFAVFSAAAKAACAGDGAAVDPSLDEEVDLGAAEETDGERAQCLRAETFFATVARSARAGQLTTAGIFGKPKLAQLFAGRTVDPGRPDADHLWTPCQPGSGSNPDFCRGQGRPNDGYAPTDAPVMDEVLRTVREGVDEGGVRKRPNLTFVNLPTVDSAGHGFGRGPAYDTAVGLADAELRRFVEQQQALGLWERTTILLTSDHSMDTTRTGPQGLAPALELAGLGDDLLVVNNGSADLVYLRDRSAPQAQRDALLARAREVVLTSPLTAAGVDEALYRRPNAADGGEQHTLGKVHPEWRIAGPRTGDLLVTARPGFAFDESAAVLTGNHGSPFARDNAMAVIGGDPRIRTQVVPGTRDPSGRNDDTAANPGQSENVDVAPTALALLGLPAPAQSEGRVLAEAFSAVPAVPGARSAACDLSAGLSSVRVTPRGRGLALAFGRVGGAGPVRVDVLRHSAGRRVLGERGVARFTRTGGFAWTGRGAGDGLYTVRLRTAVPGGRVAERRVALARREGRFAVRAASDREPRCGLLLTAKLERPAFGGTSGRALGIAFRLARAGRVTVDVLRGGRVVRRLGAEDRAGGTTHRLRLPARGLRRGDHTVRITVTSGGDRVVTRLVARRL